MEYSTINPELRIAKAIFKSPAKKGIVQENLVLRIYRKFE